MTAANTDRFTSAEESSDGTSLIDKLERAGQVGSWSLDLTTGLVDFSPYLCRTLNAPPRALREQREELIIVDDVDASRSLIAQAAVEHMPVTFVSRMRPRGSDDLIWFRHSGEPVLDEYGTLVGYAGTSKRIDHEIAADQQRSMFEQTLERVQRDESTIYLVGALAHELLNLLQPVMLLSDLAAMALDEGDTEEVHDHLRRIGASATSASSLLRSTLDFARLDPGEAVPVSARVLIEDLESFLDPELRQRVEVDVADDVVGLQFSATRRGLVQMTVNLLKNAGEASAADDQIDLHIWRSQRGDDHADAVHLSIRDRGPGFSAEGLARAFDPRFTTRAAADGNGLGLTVVRSLVEGWGGSVTIGNDPSGGARVDIEFPAFRPESGSTAPEQ